MGVIQHWHWFIKLRCNAAALLKRGSGPVVFLQILQKFSKHLLEADVHFQISALKNFAIFTGKQLCWSLFLLKFQDPKTNGAVQPELAVSTGLSDFLIVT